MGRLGDVLAHPEELVPMLRIYAATKRATRLPDDPKLAFCYDMLNRVSRSFALVIQCLPNPLRDAICVFYLVLRGLDTVEDDMALPAHVKLPLLLTFHEKIHECGFTLSCGYGHYVRLMARFDTVLDVFAGLEPQFQAVITDITQRMGEGMAEFIPKQVETLADYDLYCHYVAGLVGIGLSQLFASSGLESARYGQPGMEALSNHMGLFLQKTNIIRDYLEDINELPAPRMFWPEEVWGQYAEQLEDFKQPEHRHAAVQCLNHMVVNALHHLPHCMRYMRGLADREVFRFCAIPQIMAIGTLAACYNNGAVFEGVVKMRRGLTARVFNECDGMRHLLAWVVRFLHDLQDKALTQVAHDDPTREVMLQLVGSSLQQCEPELAQLQADAPRVVTTQQRLLDMSLLLFSGAWFYAVWQLGPQRPAGSLLQVPVQLVGHHLDGVHRALALMMLLAMLSRVVFVKVSS